MPFTERRPRATRWSRQLAEYPDTPRRQSCRVLNEPARHQPRGNPDSYRGDILGDDRPVRASRETKVVNLDGDPIRATNMPVAGINGPLGRSSRRIRALKQPRRDPTLLIRAALARLAAAHLHD